MAWWERDKFKLSRQSDISNYLVYTFYEVLRAEKDAGCFRHVYVLVFQLRPVLPRRAARNGYHLLPEKNLVGEIKGKYDKSSEDTAKHKRH